MKTPCFFISRDPQAMRELLRRIHARELQSLIARRRFAAKHIHRARLGRETIESNLPLR